MKRNEAHSEEVVVNPLPAVDAEDMRFFAAYALLVHYFEAHDDSGNRDSTEDEVAYEEGLRLLLEQLFIESESIWRDRRQIVPVN